MAVLSSLRVSGLENDRQLTLASSLLRWDLYPLREHWARLMSAISPSSSAHSTKCSGGYDSKAGYVHGHSTKLMLRKRSYFSQVQLGIGGVGRD